MKTGPEKTKSELEKTPNTVLVPATMSSKSQASLQSKSSGQMRLVTNQLLVAHIGFGLKLTCFFSFCCRVSLNWLLVPGFGGG